MSETMQQLRAAVRTLLLRPSELQLPDSDIDQQIVNELRALVQDLEFADRPLLTKSAFLELDLDEDGVDFYVNVPSVEDFEYERLEYGIIDADGFYTTLRHDVLVDFNNFANQANQSLPVAAFYGSTRVEGGALKLRTSLDAQAALSASWRLWYREPLLAIVQNGDSPPIPTNFMPMVQYGVAIRCMPIVRKKDADWIGWMQRTLPQYRAEYLTWNNPTNLHEPGRWRNYLDKSKGPQIVRLPRFDDRRRFSARGTRGVLPRGRP